MLHHVATQKMKLCELEHRKMSCNFTEVDFNSFIRLYAQNKKTIESLMYHLTS